MGWRSVVASDGPGTVGSDGAVRPNSGRGRCARRRGSAPPGSSRSAGLSVPLPVRAAVGRVLATIEGCRWRLHEAIKLGPAPITITPDLARVAGHALGVLHRLALPTDRSITAPPSAPIQARWLTSQPTEQQWRTLARCASEADAQWAVTLDALKPTLVAAASMCRDLSGERTILSKHRLIPGDVRARPDRNIGHPQTGSTPVRCRLVMRSEPRSPSVTRATTPPFCVPTSTVTAGRCDSAGARRRNFTTAISATLNWTATRIDIALTSCDEERREVAAREVPGLLANPPTRERFERIIEAVT